MSKVYCIGRTSTECCGHGDYREVTNLTDGSPVFGTRKSAQEYLDKADKWKFYKIIEMEYRR